MRRPAAGRRSAEPPQAGPDERHSTQCLTDRALDRRYSRDRRLLAGGTGRRGGCAARHRSRCRQADADFGDAEVAIVLTDDSGIRTLNRDWRGIDKPTNVLSFPALQPTARLPATRRACSATSPSPTRSRGARPRRAQAVRASSQPSGRAWISPSDRLRSRERCGRRENGKPGADNPRRPRRSRSLCDA